MSGFFKNIFFLLLTLQFVPLLIKNVKKIYSDMTEPKTEVGIINIKGEINESMGARTIDNLRKMFESPTIKAIVINIDSGGGLPGTSQAIFNEIHELKKNISPKYVLALVENCAASGAYYIACAADFIISTPSAIIGSIGAYARLFSVKKIADKYDLDCDIVKAGQYKGAGNIFSPITSEQKTEIQGVLDNVYAQFVKDVLSKREKCGLSKKSNIWAEGKIFSGEQALKLGLIDQIGSISNAIEALRKHAAIIGKINWIKPDEPFNLIKFLGGDIDSGDIASAIFPKMKIYN